MNHKKLERLASTPQLSGTGSGRGYVFQTGVADTTTTSEVSSDKVLYVVVD